MEEVLESLSALIRTLSRIHNTGCKLIEADVKRLEKAKTVLAKHKTEEWNIVQSSYGTCKICGCTDDNACIHPDEGPCWWVDDEHTLCSHCQNHPEDNSVERPAD